MPIKYGHVYFKYWERAKKKKFYIPVFVEPVGRLRGFLINTDPPEFFRGNRDLVAHAIHVSKELNSFLEHDSCLVCNEVVGTSYSEAELEGDPNAYCGPLDLNLQLEVLRVVQSSRLIPEYDKALILANWLTPPAPVARV